MHNLNHLKVCVCRRRWIRSFHADIGSVTPLLLRCPTFLVDGASSTCWVSHACSSSWYTHTSRNCGPARYW